MSIEPKAPWHGKASEPDEPRPKKPPQPHAVGTGCLAGQIIPWIEWAVADINYEIKLQFSSQLERMSAMSQELDQIKAALTDLATTVTAGIAGIETLLAKIPTAADAQEVADIVAQAQATAAALKAEVAKVPTT